MSMAALKGGVLSKTADQIGPCGFECSGYRCLRRQAVDMRQARGNEELIEVCLGCPAYVDVLEIIPRATTASQLVTLVGLLADRNPDKLEQVLSEVPENRLVLWFDDLRGMGNNSRVKLYPLLPNREQRLLLQRMSGDERRRLARK
jgi:hypothetical protein